MSVETLIERLRQGNASIDDLMAEAPVSRPTGIATLWRRSALVRAFDQDLYEKVLARGLDVASFTEFVQSPDVERLPTQSPSFYIGDEVRRRCFAAWKMERTELATISAELVNYYQAHSAPLDVFVHRIFADSRQALVDFESLYREADDRFDLAGCDALLRLVRNRLDLIDQASPLRIALQQREQYLQSRTLFADDYYRTVSFLERKPLVASCEAFLADTQKWILHVFGKGGTGKTMLLRWLVARRCVKERASRRIPVARLDFDRLDLASFSRAPWLVLPAIGEQLEQQMAGGSWLSFLLGVGEFAPLLGRSALELPAAVVRKRLQAQGRELGEKAKSWFISALAGAEVVVVLDTVEEPLLHHRAALRSVLDLFVYIRRHCTGFRVVLAGRYNIADPGRLRRQAKALAGAIEYCEVTEFTREESADFLRRLGGVSRNDAVLAAVHEHTRGNPLELSLFAELLRSDPSISTPAKVKEVYPITRFAYLLDRIIKRIPDDQEDVRWLLRYAVIPRRLTLRFFTDVLARQMPAAKRLDAPNVFRGPLDRYAGQEIWKHGEGRSRNERIWKEVQCYASVSSWVVPQEGELRLQPELVNPMRELLQEQSDETFRLLHSKAAIYFERLARRERSRWAEHITEAIYHRFQRDGRGAIAFWKAQLADRRAQEPEVRERIAGVVLGGEFIDDETLAPRPHRRTGTIVDRETCARAAFEVCLAAVTHRMRMTAEHPAARQLKEQVAEYAKKLDRFDTGKRAVVLEHRRSFLRGVVAIFRGWVAEGERLVRAALMRETRRDLRLLMEFRLALTERYTRPGQAARRFEAARQLAVRTRSQALPAWWIDYRLAKFHLRQLDFVAAGERFGRAYHGMEALRPRPPEMSDCLRRAVQAYLETGQLTEARQLLERARGAGGRLSSLFIARHLGSAQLALKQLAPAVAQRHVDAAREAAIAAGNGGVVAELDGDLAAFRLLTSDMERHYTRASAIYAQAGSLRGQVNCNLKRVRYYLEELGQGAAARNLLSQTKRSLDPWSVNNRFLLGVRLAAFSRTPRLFSAPRGVGQAQRARALAAALAAGRYSGQQVEIFLEALREVRPRTLRGELLREFVVSDRPARPHRAAVSRLLRLTSLSPERQEYPVHAFYLAAALRFFGSDRHARRLLLQALEWANQNSYLRCKLQLALEVLDPRQATDLETVLHGTSVSPGLRATILVSEAERCLAGGEPDTATRRLEEAYETLDELGDDTVWHIRAFELSGRLAELRLPERALPAYRNALDCARRTENRSAQARLEERLRRLRGRPRSAALPRTLYSPAVVLELAFGPQALRATVRSPAGRESTRVLAAGAGPDLIGALLVGGSEVYSTPMLELLRGPDPRLAPMAGEIVGISAKRPEADLALTTVDRSIWAFPWEMGLAARTRRAVYRTARQEAGRETVQWIQAALSVLGYPCAIDGELGPRTRAALHSFAPRWRAARRLKERLRHALRSTPQAPARVLVLRAGLEESRREGRGHSAIGMDIMESYQALKNVEQVVATADPEGLGSLMQRLRPTLIHIVTGFLESGSTREIHLDFSQPRRGETSSLQPVHFTAGLCASLLNPGRTELPPFVIVEAILPDDDYDRARQVLLRNAFCAELLTLARTRGVLAKGFFFRTTLLTGYRQLFQWLSREPSAGELHRSVWTDLPAAFPPALFTTDPDLPVLR